jgi:hypothetical protein
VLVLVILALGALTIWALRRRASESSRVLTADALRIAESYAVLREEMEDLSRQMNGHHMTEMEEFRAVRVALLRRETPAA